MSRRACGIGDGAAAGGMTSGEGVREPKLGGTMSPFVGGIWGVMLGVGGAADVTNPEVGVRDFDFSSPPFTVAFFARFLSAAAKLAPAASEAAADGAPAGLVQVGAGGRVAVVLLLDPDAFDEADEVADKEAVVITGEIGFVGNTAKEEKCKIEL